MVDCIHFDFVWVFTLVHLTGGNLRALTRSLISRLSLGITSFLLDFSLFVKGRLNFSMGQGILQSLRGF